MRFLTRTATGLTSSYTASGLSQQNQAAGTRAPAFGCGIEYPDRVGIIGRFLV